MHAVILHGGTPDDTGLEAAYTQLCNAISAKGWTVETHRLAEMSIRHCVGCFNCWLRTPGECAIQDDGRTVTRAQVQCDVKIYLTPVSFGGYSGLLKTAVDRQIPAISPLFIMVNGEMHHKLRYPNPPAFFAIGWQRRPDADSAGIFAEVVQRNALNMHSPVSGSVVLSGEQAVNAQRGLIDNLLNNMEVKQ